MSGINARCTHVMDPVELGLADDVREFDAVPFKHLEGGARAGRPVGILRG
jgi:hypothetical protein